MMARVKQIPFGDDNQKCEGEKRILPLRGRMQNSGKKGQR